MSATQPLERRLEPHAWGEGADFWGPRHEYRESLMMRILRSRLDGGRVLNAGCGAGSLTLRLLDLGLDVTSVDASRPFVEQLADRVRISYPSRDAPVLAGDIVELPFPDAGFDAVVCGEVLEHLDDDRAAVAELARVLRPGGVLVASVPANPWRYDWVDHWAGHRRRYTHEGIAELVGGAGFERVEVTSWGFPLTALYHRMVYEPLLRRRVQRAASDGLSQGRVPGWVARIARMVLELDTLFLGHGRGIGFLVSAHRSAATAPSASAS